MRRDTLARFFQRAVLAALPLAGAACGGSKPWIVDGGLDDAYGCDQRCAEPLVVVDHCAQETDSSGGAVTHCYAPPFTGRRPDGLVAAQGSGTPLGVYFAEAAHLEAASVPAFRRLRRELRAHGAPRRLIDACARAARNEVRHARAMGRLARRFGGQVPRVRLAAERPRPLVALAVDNAQEGCVRESFGALVATYQAETAGDAEVRALMRGIAVDETRHAELAWAIDAWLRSRLDDAERGTVEAARHAALAGLGLAATPALADTVGLPPPAAAEALRQAFAAEVARRA